MPFSLARAAVAALAAALLLATPATADVPGVVTITNEASLNALISVTDTSYRGGCGPYTVATPGQTLTMSALCVPTAAVVGHGFTQRGAQCVVVNPGGSSGAWTVTGDVTACQMAQA